MHPLSSALPLPYVPARVTRAMVLWLLIGTRSRLLFAGLLSIAEALCPSLCLFGTILVILCLMVWDWRVSRAEPMLSCWHDLLFIFCLLLFYIFLPSMGWLCGVGVFGLIDCPHFLPALHSGLQNNNINNDWDRAVAIAMLPAATNKTHNPALACSVVLAEAEKRRVR